MLCHVEATSRNVLPQQDQDFKWVSQAMLVPLGGQVRLSCGYVGTLGAILGSNSAIQGPMMICGLSSGDTPPASPKTTPNYTSNTLFPMAIKA